MVVKKGDFKLIGDNVIEKFQRFWAGLEPTERGTLWDILSALRGPDDGAFTKVDITAVIRYIIFPRIFRDAVSGSSYYPMTHDYMDFQSIVKDSHSSHSVGHVRAAIRQLVRLGYIPEEGLDWLNERLNEVAPAHGLKELLPK